MFACRRLQWARNVGGPWRKMVHRMLANVAQLPLKSMDRRQSAIPMIPATTAAVNMVTAELGQDIAASRLIEIEVDELYMNVEL